ncbi:uncharacterized protein LOC125755277 isoform X2 [Canis lupus dingo]|uniref:uncharacterized protein LOC125755277 isoform X2 n=1 Tax=Canis lupus dingo TaxID=286419 RepID=UPI0020C38D8E|nr:uncharacterized protein LOC125755277 isoform X2 [Canis lupus dingo]
MAARDRETVAPEAGAGGGLPGRSATPQPEYGPSPGTRPWLRRRQSPVEAPAARALLPPPAASRGFHAGSADVPPRPRPAGRRRGGAAWRRRACNSPVMERSLSISRCSSRGASRPRHPDCGTCPLPTLPP